MENIIYLILIVTISTIFGNWGYNIVQKKGGDPIIGAYLGCYLTFVGIIICYCFKNKTS